MLRSCTPSAAHAAEPDAATGTPASTSGGGLGDACSAAAVNGSAASDLVSAAASEEGAAAAGAEEEEALPLEGGSYTAFCQATGNRLFAAREWGQAVAW